MLKIPDDIFSDEFFDEVGWGFRLLWLLIKHGINYQRKLLSPSPRSSPSQRERRIRPTQRKGERIHTIKWIRRGETRTPPYPLRSWMDGLIDGRGFLSGFFADEDVGERVWVPCFTIKDLHWILRNSLKSLFPDFTIALGCANKFSPGNQNQI